MVVLALSFPFRLLPEPFLIVFVVEDDGAEKRPSKLSLLSWRVGDGRGFFTPQIRSEFEGPVSESGVTESSLELVAVVG